MKVALNYTTWFRCSEAPKLQESTVRMQTVQLYITSSYIFSQCEHDNGELNCQRSDTGGNKEGFNC